MARGNAEIHPDLVASVLRLTGLRLDKRSINTEKPTMIPSFDPARYRHPDSLRWLVMAPRKESDGTETALLVGAYATIGTVWQAIQSRWKEWGFTRRPPTLAQLRWVCMDSKRALAKTDPEMRAWAQERGYDLDWLLDATEDFVNGVRVHELDKPEGEFGGFPEE